MESNFFSVVPLKEGGKGGAGEEKGGFFRGTGLRLPLDHTTYQLT